MKKMIVLAFLFAGILLTGCSVDLFTSNEESLGTKIEKFEDRSEDLENEFVSVIEELERLEEKKDLSSQDQKQIVEIVDNLSTVLDDFQEEDAPILNWLKDYSVEKVMERVEILEDIRDKAQNGDATIKDVRVMKEALTDDFEIRLFGN